MRRILNGVVLIAARNTLALGILISTTRLYAVEETPVKDKPDKPPAASTLNQPRPPAGSLFEMRIVADLKYDKELLDITRYRWVKLDPLVDNSLDGLLIRVDKENGKQIAVRSDPQNLTERDILEVKKTQDERDQPAIYFKMTRDGARRLGELTRSHLPIDQGAFKYRLALIVEGVVVSIPSINSEIHDAGIIEFSRSSEAGKVNHLIKILSAAAASNAPFPQPKVVKDQAEALREAKLVDIPLLIEANRAVITFHKTDLSKTATDRKTLTELRILFKTNEVTPSAGLKAATIQFYRDDDLIRSIWLYEGGEWGFERPGVKWTTGSNPELWKLVNSILPKT